MGRSRIIPTIVEQRIGLSRWDYVAAWNAKHLGRPTETNLRAWRETYNRSFLPGGVNAHIGIRGQIHIDLRVRSQITGEIKAQIA